MKRAFKQGLFPLCFAAWLTKNEDENLMRAPYDNYKKIKNERMKLNREVATCFSTFILFLFISNNVIGQTPDKSELWVKAGFEAYENQDTVRAFNCFSQAVALGNYDAYNNLGFWYTQCDKNDNKLLKAKNWFLQAAQADNKWAMFNMATMYLFGIGVEEDYIKANAYFEKFKSKGTSDAIIESWEKTKKKLNQMHWLLVNADGSMIIKSIDTDGPNDLVKADSLFKLKIYDGIFKIYKSYNTNGYLKSQLNLGFMYWFGYDVPVDIHEAIKCYQIAAEKNSPYAQFTLASIYYNGINVKQDRERARELYQQALYNLPEDYERKWNESVVKDSAAVVIVEGNNYVISKYIYKSEE